MRFAHDFIDKKLIDKKIMQKRTDLTAITHSNKQKYHDIVTEQRVGYAVKELLYSDFVSLIKFPEFPFQLTDCQIIKAGNTAFLAKTHFQIDRKIIPVAYKRVRRKNVWKKLKSFFQTNHALHCFRIGHEMLQAGIATPRPLAVLVPHRHQPNKPSYLAVQWVENAVDLETFCQHAHQEKAIAQQNAKHLAISLGQLLGKIHSANFSHRDLKSSNILVQTTNATTNTTFETMVIDLDGAARQSHLSVKRRCWNLSRLALDMRQEFSLSNHLRFLKAYFSESTDSPVNWKSIWKKVDKMTIERFCKKQKQAA
ncbi:hypothetical protein MNBD_PLANCTO02-71 [hydrothermal vent metagenome]|uniref:Protein kinase domain-containing protein n=1 Tax=hydrothermal vent metagenome TaxID=652676 RepID=A0A3B1E6X9_9ZZZZ